MKALSILSELLLIAAFAGIASGQTYSIAGVVVNTQSGSPMNRVRVALTVPQGKIAPAPVMTGLDGRFAFQVPQGRYSLSAETGGVREPFGWEGPMLGFGVSIITGTGQDTGHLTFHWFPLGAITGTVTDDRGEPVEKALVQLIRSAVVGGRKRVTTVNWFRTDDRGVYRFAPLFGGTYYLAVTGEPWYVERSSAMRRIGSPNQEASPAEAIAAYAPVYFPSGSDVKSAAAIVVKPAAEVRADFRLRTVTGVNVLVNCPNGTGKTGLLSLITERIEGIEGPEGFQRQLNFYGRAQTIAGVPPGRYVVRIAGTGENPFSVRKTIDVGASDVTVDLPILPAATVSGKVTFANPAARPKSTMYVRLVNDTTGAILSRAVDADGSFAFPNVVNQRARPQITGADGFFVSQAAADDVPLKSGVFDVVDGAAINLTLIANDQTGHVKGFVMAGETPLAGVLAVLAPKVESTDQANYRGFQTDSDGSFDWVNVRAGEYVLFAVTKLDLEYASAEVVRPYLADGRAIRVEAHSTSTERIGLWVGQH